MPSSRLICWVKLPSSSFVGGTCVYGTWSLFGNVRAGFVKILKNIKKYFIRYCLLKSKICPNENQWSVVNKGDNRKVQFPNFQNSIFKFL